MGNRPFFGWLVKRAPASALQVVENESFQRFVTDSVFTPSER
jgi:hypothetical protein